MSLAAALFAVALGIPMGVYTGIHRHSLLSKVFLTVSLIGVSLPTFLIGILLIYVFAVWLGVLPSFGRGEVVRIGFWRTGLLTTSGLKALIMPAVTLGLFQMTLVTRLVRSEMMEVLRADYIKFARARGLPERTINFGHALKNTLVPVITVIGLQLGAIIAFAIITETVFQWPGMGLMFIQAVQNADIPVMAAYLHAGGVHVRVHQFRRRSHLRAGRSAHPHLRPERLSAMQDAPESIAPPRAAAIQESAGAGRGVRRGRLAEFLDSDLLHCFPALQAGGRRRPAERGHRQRGVAGTADRPARSLRSQVAEPARRQHAAGLGEGRRAAVPARHRRPGPRHPLHHALRHALLAADRHLLGAARQRLGAVARAVGRLRGRARRLR